MKAEYSSYQEIESILRGTVSHKIAYLPVGCTEQHGPILPLGTDTLIAKNLAIDLCTYRKIKNESGIIYPEIAYSPSRSNIHYSGSTTVFEETFRSYCKEVCLSVLRHNFDALVILCTHGPAEPSLVEIAFQLNRNQFEGGEKIRPIIVLGMLMISKVFQKWLGGFAGKHADYREFLLLYRAIGIDFFKPEVIDALEEFSSRYAKTNLPVIDLLGVPMELRSLEGVIGSPMCNNEQSHKELAEEVWNDLIFKFSEAIDKSMTDLKTL